MHCKWFVRSAAVLLALGVGGTARADVVSFNPNGTGAGGATNIIAFDEAPGNAVAVGAAPQAVGTTFTLFYQATISTYTDTSNVQHTFPTPFTMVAAFREQITSITGPASTPTFTFALVPGGTNYLEIYANQSPNNSLGTGFNTGTPILTGTIFSSTPSVGSFTVQSPTPVAFDQADVVVPPKFVGQLTAQGNGATSVSANVTSFNPNYFINPPRIIGLNFTSENDDPFRAVSPSQTFVAGPNGSGLTYSPTLGAVNGVSGPDVQFQADASNNFVTPEPASFALLGTGIAISLLGRAKLTRKKAA